MQTPHRLLPVAIAALLAGAGAFVPGRSRAASAQSAPNPSSVLLQQVADQVWQHKLTSPAVRLAHGLPIDALPRWSAAAAEADAAFSRSMLTKLDAVDEPALNHEESLTLAVVRWDARNTIEDAGFFWLHSPVTPYAFHLATVHRIFQTFRFERPADAERYLDLLAEYPGVIEQIHSHLRRQTDRGIVLPKAEIEIVISFLKGFVQEPGQSLFSVSDQRLTAIDAPAAGRFKQQLAAEILARTNPALERLIGYVSGGYREHAPEPVGLWQYPGGTDYYRYLVKLHTTMEVTPAEVHEIGLREVDRLEREMAEVRTRLGFRGTKAEFHTFLKTDPRFFPKTPEEIRATLLGFANGINPKLDRIFATRPKAPFDVQRLEPALEASVTFGYYDPPRPGAPTGTYFFNGSKLAERSLLQAEALIYHELVPGHHFHFASQNENDKLHPLRKTLYPSAFTEGWAMYSAILGRELGRYQDLYELYGHLSMEVMIAVRLVVDTGMNDLQWPRARAMAYMRDHTLNSETEIATESLRYSADIPGQALAYKMGEMKIMTLREQARQSLGNAFDIRRFHAAVLGSGALPMTVLEWHINWFLEQEGRR